MRKAVHFPWLTAFSCLRMNESQQGFHLFPITVP